MKRLGRKKRPFYRIVVMDSRTRRDGAEIERLGWFDPLKETTNYSVDVDRSLYWLGQGANPSKTVNTILKRAGINLRWHLMRNGYSEEDIAKELENWEKSKLVNKDASNKSEKPDTGINKPAPETDTIVIEENTEQVEISEE